MFENGRRYEKFLSLFIMTLYTKYMSVVNKITKISSTYVKYLLSYVVKIKRKVYVV